MNRKTLQLLLVIAVFNAVMLVALGVTPLHVAETPLAVIDVGRSIGGSAFTVNDMLITLQVFGTAMAVAVFVTQYKKGRT